MTLQKKIKAIIRIIPNGVNPLLKTASREQRPLSSYSNVFEI